MAVVDAATIAVLAEELLVAERDGTSVAPLTERHPGFALADAYAVQRHGRALRTAAGATLVGHKVGLTSLAMQQLLGVDEPDFGYLTAAMLVDDGAMIDGARLVAPRVEAEIALRLHAPLHGKDITFEEALAAVGEVAPALEIVDSRVADWRITLPDTVADNASSGLAVFGRFVPLGDTDLAAEQMAMEVTRADGTIEDEEGPGSAVLGHPVHALVWLVRTLAAFDESIAAGAVVIPGAMARATTLRAGDAVRARFSTLGPVSVDVARPTTQEGS
jgi:2-keto-4-pentenoate hydratase